MAKKEKHTEKQKDSDGTAEVSVSSPVAHAVSSQEQIVEKEILDIPSDAEPVEVVEPVEAVLPEAVEVDTVSAEAAEDEEGLHREIKGGVDVDAWKPKTELGKLVKEGKITKIDEILDAGKRILESEIVDILLPQLDVDLLMIGQSKGKFGGGSRRVFRQTQKKTREGNKPKFSTIAVVGNKDGYVGIGYGKAKETVPAREKAIRRAKLNVFKIRRGTGSWEDAAAESHSIPFAVEGKCGSVRLKLMPAPKGTGLCIEKECAKILRLAGIESVWSKSLGSTKTKMNTIIACEKALKQLMRRKISQELEKKLSIVEGFKNQ